MWLEICEMTEMPLLMWLWKKLWLQKERSSDSWRKSVWLWNKLWLEETVTLEKAIALKGDCDCGRNCGFGTSGCVVKKSEYEDTVTSKETLNSGK